MSVVLIALASAAVPGGPYIDEESVRFARGTAKMPPPRPATRSNGTNSTPVDVLAAAAAPLTGWTIGSDVIEGRTKP